MNPQAADITQSTVDIEPDQEKPRTEHRNSLDSCEKREDSVPYRQDAFGDEETAEVKYKVLTWW